MSSLITSIFQMYEHMLHPVLIFDINFQIHYLNLAAKEYYACQKREIILQTLFDFDVSLKEIETLERFKAHLSTKKSFNRNSLCRAQDGRQYQVEMNISAVELERRVYYVQQHFNMTPSPEQENLCQIETNLLSFTQNLLDNIPIPFFYKNRYGQYIGCNKAFEKIIGLSRKQLIYRTAAELFQPEVAQLIQQYDYLLMTGQKESVDYQMTMIFGDGSAHQISFSKTVVNKTELSSAEIVGVMIDISEIKQKEFLLREAKNAAEASVRAKSEFLENMSHELRTPMNATMGMTSMLLATNLDEEQREYANLINQENHHLLEILDKILNYSRYTKESFVLKSIDFSLKDLIGSIVNHYAKNALTKQITLKYTIQEEVPDLLLGDPNCLSEILKHLLDNAIKFTSQGEILLTANLSAYLPNEKLYCLRFNVQDTGIGIDQNKLRSIFDAFNQADNSRVRQYGGVGLGLSISARLIALMKGVIWVESEVGQGSVFRFTAYFKESDFDF